jgi:hypothetical protein
MIIQEITMCLHHKPPHEGGLSRLITARVSEIYNQDVYGRVAASFCVGEAGPLALQTGDDGVE